MSRVKRGTKARHRRKRLLKEARGFYGARSRTYKVAKETVHRAWVYAYRDRRRRKRNFRRLWIIRINAAAREFGTNYSKLMGGLKRSRINIDRKILADLAVNDKERFGRLVDVAGGD